MVLPPEPPELTPGAARALLRILVKAYEQQAEAKSGPLEDIDHAERQPRTSHTDALWAMRGPNLRGPNCRALRMQMPSELRKRS